jgi:hypothetical protein
LPFILKGLQKITPSFLKCCKIFWRECEGLDPKIRVIALQFYSLETTLSNSKWWISHPYLPDHRLAPTMTRTQTKCICKCVYKQIRKIRKKKPTIARVLVCMMNSFLRDSIIIMQFYNIYLDFFLYIYMYKRLSNLTSPPKSCI